MQIEHDLRLPIHKSCFEHRRQFGDVVAGDSIPAANHIHRTLMLMHKHWRLLIVVS
jgi:hypothetical protein